MASAKNDEVVTDEEWEDFKKNFEKSYKDADDEKKHRDIYMENKKSIAEHNAKYEKGEETYTKGINQFSDMTEEECQQYTGFVTDKKKKKKR